MFGSVEKDEYKGPVKIGIGTSEQHRQLSALGCERVYTVAELGQGEHDHADPVKMIFRDGDTVVMLQPGLLPVALMRSVASMGVDWQVPGHDAETLDTEDARAMWRRQKPRNLEIDVAPEVMGRPPKWPVPNDAQMKTILSLWYSKMKRVDLIEAVRKLMGADVPAHWVRDQVIKATGSAKRIKDEERSE